jgi:hypothetical protein
MAHEVHCMACFAFHQVECIAPAGPRSVWAAGFQEGPTLDQRDTAHRQDFDPVSIAKDVEAMFISAKPFINAQQWDRALAQLSRDAPEVVMNYTNEHNQEIMARHIRAYSYVAMEAKGPSDDTIAWTEWSRDHCKTASCDGTAWTNLGLMHCHGRQRFRPELPKRAAPPHPPPRQGPDPLQRRRLSAGLSRRGPA